ncbi:MAG: hypothetical protein B7X57_10065, partial [Erythrobacter sp. 34-65-8]
MNESNFASLSSGLLARKGGAKPAMRPQVAIMPTDGSAAHNLEDLGWNDMGDEEPHRDSTVLQLTPEPANPQAAAEARENDAVAQAKLAEEAGRKPVIVEQQEAIAAKVAQQAVAAPSRPLSVVEHTPQNNDAFQAPDAVHRMPRKRRSALERGKRAAFTLRLDADRHLKLRLACTLRNR